MVFTRLIASWRRLIDWCKVACRDYRHVDFLKADIGLAFSNPYRISKEYLVATGASDPYQYGETPLSTLRAICHHFGVQEGERVFELGCGPGRTAFWLSSVMGCRVVGIEQIPSFVARAKRLATRLSLAHLEFRCEDFTNSNYSEADTLYLYGTCLPNATIVKLSRQLSTLKKGGRLITVSYPFSDYDESFTLIDQVDLPFTWGRTTVYLQRKI